MMTKEIQELDSRIIKLARRHAHLEEIGKAGTTEHKQLEATIEELDARYERLCEEAGI